MPSDMEKLKELNKKTYKEQAVWFLNAFWDTHEPEADKVWGYANMMSEMDEKNGSSGNELSEFIAHRFLEKCSETKTVRELRETLRKIDIDSNKFVSLSEYLIFRFSIDWHKLVNAAQSDNKEEIDKAQALLEAAQQKLAAARNSAAEARKAEAAQKRAEAEQRVALAELEKEEKAFETKKSNLEKKCTTGGIVSMNRAKNELQQLLGEDPLPLRRAKINQQAAVRASERATAAAVELRAQAEAALKEANVAFEEAEAFMQEVKMKGGSGQGVLWWIERELAEAKKYLPQSRGGVAKK